MKRLYAALCLFVSFGAGAVAHAEDCNRDCLKRHLDTYLSAVTSHKPETAGLWAGFRQTENSIVVPEGQGVWANVTGLGSIQRRYLDPIQAQAGYFGTVKMGEEEAVVAVRLKVQWKQVTEAEWFISRKSDPGLTGEPGKTPFNIDTLRATLPEQRVVPKSERLQREALQAVVNSYFDGITSHNGYVVKGHPGCSRYENGFPTFNTPMKEGMDLGNNGKTDCRTQADFGVAIVAIRNFYVIDEESQAVMVAAMFRRDAQSAKRRNHFTELFHIDHGKIRDIHAAFYYPPETRPVPNWPAYDGLFPLPSASASDAAVIREAKDRAEIEKLMWDYARALDTGNAEAYAAVYTPDGAFGDIKGHDALKKMVDDLNKSRAERKAKGEAVWGTLHMTANHYIEFIDADHARLHNYWLTAFVPPPAAPATARAAATAAATAANGAANARPELRTPYTGRGVDDLVRVNGKWFIKSRNVAPKD